MLSTAALLQKIDQFVKIARQPLPKYRKVFGPYSRNSGRGRGGKPDQRQIVILQHEEKCDCQGCDDYFKTHKRIKGRGRLSTQSYPKWIVEERLGEKLDANETIDHVSYDVLDNSEENLRIVDRKEHSALDTRRVKLVDCTCAGCGKPFQRSPRMLRDKAKAGKSGPYCSRACAARDARYVQYGKKERAPVQQGQASEYFRRKIQLQENAEKMAAKWGAAITKLASQATLRNPSDKLADFKHLSPEDEEIMLSEVIEEKDTVPVELWRKYKHREGCGVQWRPPEEKPAKKAMNTRFNGGIEPEFLDEIDVEQEALQHLLDASIFDEIPEEVRDTDIISDEAITAPIARR
jgi:hypothetical protein